MTFFFLKRKAVQVFSAVVTSLSRKHIGKPKNQTGEGKKEERGGEGGRISKERIFNLFNILK